MSVLDQINGLLICHYERLNWGGLSLQTEKLDEQINQIYSQVIQACFILTESSV